jgi:hypothetical protein
LAPRSGSDLDDDAPQCFVINLVTSDFPPIDPFVVRFVHPLFIIDESLDPSDLRAPPKAKEEEKIDEKAEKMLAVLRGADREGDLDWAEWQAASGLPKSTFSRKLKQLICFDGPVYKSGENGKFQLTPRYVSEWESKMEGYDSNNE